VAHLINADALVLLSDVDALYDGPPHRPGSRRIPEVGGAADLAEVVVKGSASNVGTGGMGTKLEAAGIATAAGVATLLTSAGRVREGLAGEDVGTLFTPTGSRRASRLLWLAHATEPRGRVLLDAGAVRAVVDRRKSLLPAGITAVEGRFDEGDPIDVCTPEGEPVARGLVNYSSDELPGMLGRTTHDLARDLGPQYEREVIHRDAMVLLGQ
jgi:glutamate 5-kinase